MKNNSGIASEPVTAAFSSVPVTDTDRRLHFAAAAVTFGFELAPNTPGIDNVYHRGRKYSRNEPGDVKLYFASQSNGISLPALASVWDNWQEDFSDAENLPARMIAADDGGKWEECAKLAEILHVTCAAGHMRLFSLRRFALPDGPPLSDQEQAAIATLDGFAAKMRKNQSPPAALRCRLAAEIVAAWRPAMVGWVKAWVINFMEIHDVWRYARPSVRIERPGDPLPLVIPQGKHFNDCLKKWT